MAGKLTIRFSAASMDDHLETPIPGEAQPPGIQILEIRTTPSTATRTEFSAVRGG
jgi:hypothetical protein